VNPVAKAAEAAVRAASDLDRHPNDRARVKARTMSLVALVRAVQDAGHVGSAQTLAAETMGYDRQLIHRHVKRALDRGWAEWRSVDGELRLVSLDPMPAVQGVFGDVVDMETIGPPAASTVLPPLTFREPSTIV
jgi:hypothetical protein